MFQGALHSLNPVHRIGAQIAEAIHVHKPGLDGSTVTSRIAELLEKVGLDPGRANDGPDPARAADEPVIVRGNAGPVIVRGSAGYREHPETKRWVGKLPALAAR